MQDLWTKQIKIFSEHFFLFIEQICFLYVNLFFLLSINASATCSRESNTHWQHWQLWKRHQKLYRYWMECSKEFIFVPYGKKHRQFLSKVFTPPEKFIFCFPFYLWILINFHPLCFGTQLKISFVYRRLVRKRRKSINIIAEYKHCPCMCALGSID